MSASLPWRFSDFSAHVAICGSSYDLCMHKHMVSVAAYLSVEVSCLWSFNLFYVDHVCVFTTAMRSAITDEILVPSPANTKALETALALIRWCDWSTQSCKLIETFTSFVLQLSLREKHVRAKFSMSTKTVLQVIIIFKKQLKQHNVKSMYRPKLI